MWERVRLLDAFGKAREEARVKTLLGGAGSLLCFSLILVLVWLELRAFCAAPRWAESLFVDTRADPALRLEVALDLSFPALACALLSLDLMDVSGEHQDDVQRDVWKEALDGQGRPVAGSRQQLTSPAVLPTTTWASSTPGCSSCYGAESPLQRCCPDCAAVRQAYQRRGWQLPDLARVAQCREDPWLDELAKVEGQGCRVHGTLRVAKVAGNVHVAPGRSLAGEHVHVHDLRGAAPRRFNASHRIDLLRFGSLLSSYPAQPLDGHRETDLTGGSMFQYFAKVVPTVEVDDNGKESWGAQFAVTRQRRGVDRLATSSDGLPGVFVVYEFAPFVVRREWRGRPLAPLVTSLCAVAGGVFTVAALLDRALHALLPTSTTPRHTFH